MSALHHWRVSVFSPFCFYRAVFVTLDIMNGQVGNTMIAGLEMEECMYIVHKNSLFVDFVSFKTLNS